MDLDLLDMRRRVWGKRVAEKWPVRYREALEPDHDFDLIVLSVPTGDLREALPAGRELLPLLQARGLDLRRHRGGVLPFRAPWLTAPVLAWLTANVAPARVSLTAHCDPDAEEPRDLPGHPGRSTTAGHLGTATGSGGTALRP